MTEYLYHYTSIESLALILKNHTIRLNSLTEMDDKQEQLTQDVENLGRFIFVSSWTSDAEESIPMWKMYTNPQSGVRIKLRKNPFKWHGTNFEDFSRTFGVQPSSISDSTSELKTFLSLTDMFKQGVYSLQGCNGNILYEVQYTSDTALLEPKVLDIDEKKLTLSLGVLGKHKNLHWEFQHEWRYLMTFIPFSFNGSIEEIFADFNKTGSNMAIGKAFLPFKHYDLIIEDSYYQEMEITVSPQITAGNYVTLEALVEKYNPSATICESSLKNLI